MAAPALAKVHVSTVSSVRLPDAEPKRLLRRGHRDHVHVVGHEAGARSMASVPSKRKPRTLVHRGSVPDVHAALVTPLRHQIDVGLVVLVAQERSHGAIPPLRHVVGDPRHDGPS